MRALVVLALLARIASAEPVRVSLDCEDSGRTKACPAFLLGFIEEPKTLLAGPRAGADVELFIHANDVALVDKVHLRFVGHMPGAPPLIETEAEIDTRADDDTQRGQLKPAFLRGIALFVAARYPKLVSVEIAPLDETATAAPKTSPWDFSVELGGFASWTENYQSYNGWTSAHVSRLERKHRLEARLFGNGGLNRQPPLVTETGEKVSVNTKQWSLGGSGEGAWLLNDCYSFGAGTRVWRDDPKGQFRYGWNAKVGVEWDRYPADDPRGNRLAVMYYAGYQIERYNVKNVLGQRFAHYPIHALIASGSLRKDKVGIGVSVSLGGEILHPLRRHNLSASPFVEWKLGDHVDLNVSFSITKRQVVAPDPSEIDPTDFEQLSRLSYAEPLSMNGSFNIVVHLDRTNGARNDRFSDL